VRSAHSAKSAQPLQAFKGELLPISPLYTAAALRVVGQPWSGRFSAFGHVVRFSLAVLADVPDVAAFGAAEVEVIDMRDTTPGFQPVAPWSLAGRAGDTYRHVRCPPRV
jgi:hypothetical protein